MASIGLGESIPPDTAHAVSVSLPTWRANVGYEEGEAWVVSKMVTGYPRFFIHNSIKAFGAALAERFGRPGQTAVLFPSRAAAARCRDFVARFGAGTPALLDGLGLVHLGLDPASPAAAPLRHLVPTVSAVLLHPDAFSLAKQYWQHSGDGVSSRRAEYCHKLFHAGLLVRLSAEGPETATTPPSPAPAVAGMKPVRGPKRYRKPLSPTPAPAPTPTPAPAPAPTATATGRPASPTSGSDEDEDESARFLEERFGRNLDLSFVRRARAAIVRRITGAMTADNDVERAADAQGTHSDSLRGGGGAARVREDDVYLMPCGMNAIFQAHRFLLRAARPEDRAQLRSISFGFPYVDTLKILQKFGAGCLFYGHASEADLDDLERRLRGGERFLGLFCEFPGNPLLTSPDLVRIRRLADAYGFAVVVDETIGTFANVNVLPYADVVVSSLTKIFSGDCNVMGGSLVLHRRTAGAGDGNHDGGGGGGALYAALKAAAAAEYDPHALWPEDAIFLERNSRDFVARIDRVNANAEVLCDVLRASPLVRALYYPKHSPSRPNYEACRVGGEQGNGSSHAHGRTGGYGGLLSFCFHRPAQAVAFYDAVATAKGPSLGTNFTLTSPYVLLAHYQERDWCASLGVDPNLIRVSVGLEETGALRQCFEAALAAAAAVEEAEE